jgi:N-acetylneuraminate synthase
VHPWDEASLRALEAYGMAGYKVASADFTNHDLLTAMARTAKPLIASTGMSSEAEIIASVALLRQEGASFALLHCNSTYPAPYKDVNLAYMNRLKELGDCPVGYSGHERGWFVPVAAIALGASVIEKHFTVDRAMEGNDHRVSLLPDELRAMVEAIRATEQSMGTAAEREVTQGEMMNREVLAKSLHAATDIAPGTVITHAHILVRSPGQGLQPNQREALVGRTATRAIRAGTPFFPTDIEDRRIEPRAFAFARPWGIPVRYHDYRAMLDLAPLPFLEYHLSYKDMDEDLRTWFDAPLPISFAVHAPELFAGDHVLDLASPDEAYRAHSIAQLQRVIDVTRALKPWHQGPSARSSSPTWAGSTPRASSRARNAQPSMTASSTACRGSTAQAWRSFPRRCRPSRGISAGRATTTCSWTPTRSSPSAWPTTCACASIFRTRNWRATTSAGR